MTYNFSPNEELIIRKIGPKNLEKFKAICKKDHADLAYYLHLLESTIQYDSDNGLDEITAYEYFS